MRLNGKAFRLAGRGARALGAAALLACLAIALWAPFGARAEAGEPVILVPGVSVEGIEAAAHYALDDGRSVDAVIEGFADGAGVADLAAALDARETPYQALWAFVPLRNDGEADRGGEAGAPAAPDTWILTSATYGMLAVEAYLLRADGTRDYVMSYAYDEPWDPADHSASRIRSEPVALPRGATAALLTRLQFGPVADAQLALETADDLTARAFREGFALSAFYAFALAMLVFFLGFHLSLSNGVGVAYAGLFTIGLLLIAYVDGLTFRFLYPERPGWHFAFGVGVMNLLSAAGFFVAGRSLRASAPRFARHAPVLERLALAPLVVIAAVAVLPQEAVAGLSYLLVLAMFALQAAATWLWRRESGEPQRLERAVALLAAVAIAVLIGMIATGLGVRLLSPPAMLRALYGLVGLLSMLALTMALVDLRRRHARAVQARMAALEQEAESARARLEAERRYARARDLAELRQRRLATASHDIRQPLSALRMRMSASGERLSEAERGGMMQALDYLEQLSTDYLSEARPADAAQAEPDTAEPETAELETTRPETVHPETAAPERVDPFPVSLVLGAVRQMFTEDAVSKGLSLRVVDRSLETDVDPLALIRIVSNLTSNAIRHTETGRVLVGALSRGDGVEIIVADTGPGFADGAFEQLSQAWAKGSASEGEGLGLAICFEQAQRLGIALEQRAPPGKGACFVLTVPRAEG